MNLLFPRYRKQRNLDRRIYPARGWLGAFSLLAVCAIFWTGALGYPPAARAQNDAPGSQPAVVPARTPPSEAPPAEAPKVEAALPEAKAPETKAPATPKADAPKVDAPKADAPKVAPTSAAGGAAPAKSYIIGANDVVAVKVWNQPQLSGMVDVHLDGMISIQLIGEVKAEGLTASELRDVITARLEETALTAPVVDVSVVRINSKHYHVYGGGVNRPGDFTLAEKTTIMGALSLAVVKDGFAKTNKIELRHPGKPTRFFNMKDYIKGKNRDKNISLELQDGDEIIVPE